MSVACVTLLVIDQFRQLGQWHPHKSMSVWDVIKSTRSGVTSCFQFDSAASAATTTFASHVKTVSAKP